jgi:hypothetical protein
MENADPSSIMEIDLSSRFGPTKSSNVIVDPLEMLIGAINGNLQSAMQQDSGKLPSVGGSPTLGSYQLSRLDTLSYILHSNQNKL